MFLYREVDSKGNTIDFYLSKTRDKKAANTSSRKLNGLFMFLNLASLRKMGFRWILSRLYILYTFGFNSILLEHQNRW
ncbi:hypothetical protein ASG65_16935 [Bacillus sp. Leaf13]|nr:hypothetical protein ASG65_16935 [Bacillus sp. Leaf13]